MKSVLIGMLAVFAGVVTAQEAAAAAVTGAAVLDDEGAPEPAAACPTITKSIVDPGCAQDCNNDCRLITTVTNGCGCPASIPTATLVAPCGGECPNAGCDIIYRTRNEACGPPAPYAHVDPQDQHQPDVVTRGHHQHHHPAAAADQDVDPVPDGHPHDAARRLHPDPLPHPGLHRAHQLGRALRLRGAQDHHRGPRVPVDVPGRVHYSHDDGQ
ncbi:hypothetical protein PG988_007533 [Apiospora saccharicola]